MLRFSDFPEDRKRFYNLGRGLCISAQHAVGRENLEHIFI